MSDDAGRVHKQAGTRPGGSFWNPRVLLLEPAAFQLMVAYLIYQDLRGGARVTPVLMSTMLLALCGGGGIAAGVFGRSRRLLQFGILSALLGFAFPAMVLAAAAPVDNSTSTVAFLGEFDAEGLGMLLSVRGLAELPVWALYAVIVFTRYVGSRRTASRAPSQTPAGSSRPQPPSGKR